MFDVGRQAHSTFYLLFQMALGGLPVILHSAFCFARVWLWGLCRIKAFKVLDFSLPDYRTKPT